MNFFGQRKKQNNRKGVVLVTVVMVMCVGFILIGAILGLVNINTKQTMKNYRKQQAFMTASTYLESFVSQIEKETQVTASETTDKALYDSQVANRKQFINKLKTLAASNASTKNITVNGDQIKDKNMGEVELSIKTEGASENLVIMAKCKYLGEEEQVAAHIYLPNSVLPGEYTNAVEYAGDGNNVTNNGCFIGSASRINSSGDEDVNVTYKWQNNSTYHGGYFVYGNQESETETIFELQKNPVKSADGNYNGAGVTITRNFTIRQNYFMINSTMDYSLGFNYMNIGSVFTNNGKCYIGCDKSGNSSPNKVDTFCRGFYIGDSADKEYIQYGDLIVRKVGNSAGSGDMTIKGAKVHIKGNLYVEGTLTNNGANEFIVDGNIYAGATSGTMPKTVQAFDASAVKPTPSLNEGGMNEYKYDPGYILMPYKPDTGAVDTDMNKITAAYQKTYDDSTTKTLKDIALASGATTYTASGTINDAAHTSVEPVFHRRIMESFIIDQNCFNDEMKNNGHLEQKYLINVTDTTGNIVVRLSSLTVDAGKKLMFVVKNDSTLKSDGSRQYGVYFVSDSGKGTTSEEKDGVLYRNGMNGVVLNIESWGILDYDTYINTWDKEDLKTSAYNGAKTNNNVILNTSDTPEDQLPSPPPEGPGGITSYYYTPHKGNIHMILAGSSQLNSKSAGSFFECEMYCPTTKMDLRGNQDYKLRVCDSNGQEVTDAIHGNVQIVNIGMVVNESLYVENNHYFVFNQPDPGSIWGPLKGNKEKNIDGYKLSMYNYY